MLTRLAFRNYRAFPEGEFKIRPLTILVGANSVGKTSLVQLPLILKQTASVGDRAYKAALKIHGREVNIGDPKNFFFNQNIKDPFMISIGFKSDKLMGDLTRKYFEEFSELIMQTMSFYHYILIQQSNVAKPSQRFFKEFRQPTLAVPYSESELSRLLDFLTETSDLVAKVSEKKVPGHLRHLALPFQQTRTRQIEGPPTIVPTDIERVYRFLTTISGAITSPDFSYCASISLHDQDVTSKYLRVDKLSLLHNDKEILAFSIKDEALDNISSDLVQQNIVANYFKTIEKSINFQSTLFNFFSSTRAMDSRFHLPELFRAIMCSAQNITQSYFDDDALGHIGPLRAYPKRFYFLDAAYTGSTEGDLIVEALRENEELRKKVNTWLERFAINIDVSQLEEIIYRLSVRSKGNSFSLDITDVGFGISQVLPILVEGFISPMEKLIFVEQPEIHLHPRMQGELTDLFIDIANIHKKTEINGQRHVVIETHSEYLLSRLRRRIAEGSISHNDVALYFVERRADGKGSRIRGSYMPADGQFEWPDEFFEDDLNDTIMFLKSAVKRKTS